MLDEIWANAGTSTQVENLHIHGHAGLPSAFAVSDLAAASVAAAGAAAAELIAARFGLSPEVHVDRRLASLWFATTIAPEGWSLQPGWDPVAGDYATRDGWIKLHTNARHHRDAALTVLRAELDKQAVARAVSGWNADDLEAAIVAEGGCAAAMRGLSAWASHHQGTALRAMPLMQMLPCTGQAAQHEWAGARVDRPLAGLRVLDLTRVLAGPVCTRFLAGLGADVLRIDPAWWEEPGLEPETTLGKRCATLDLRSRQGVVQLKALLAQADVLVHGYRPGALDRLGLDSQTRQMIRPGLVDVSLDAYGWAGPWRDRRGFDSLVQMSCGIAHEGMLHYNTDVPRPLPVQALDHATGYMLACAVLRALTRRLHTGEASEVRASLAKTADLLVAAPTDGQQAPLCPAEASDYAEALESTPWGPARRMKPPLTVAGAPLRWHRPAGRFRSAPATWPTSG